MQDLQGEAPYHLLHLKIAVEKNRFSASVEECRAELDRETKLVSQEGSEKTIKEHRVRLLPYTKFAHICAWLFSGCNQHFGLGLNKKISLITLHGS